jgi:hypothetical protein
MGPIDMEPSMGRGAARSPERCVVLRFDPPSTECRARWLRPPCGCRVAGVQRVFQQFLQQFRKRQINSHQALFQGTPPLAEALDCVGPNVDPHR